MDFLSGLSCCSHSEPDEATAALNVPQLDPHFQGEGLCVEGNFVSGEGMVLANSLLVQSKAYWEVYVKTKGRFCVGVAHHMADLNKEVGEDEHSWGWRVDGSVRYNDVAFDKDAVDLEVGDVVGCIYDQSDIPTFRVFVNGNANNAMIQRMKGNLYPAVSTKENACLEVNFGSAPFRYQPPDGFEPVMLEQTLI